jgi:hypothetical protein
MLEGGHGPPWKPLVYYIYSYNKVKCFGRDQNFLDLPLAWKYLFKIPKTNVTDMFAEQYLT